ncbi:MAG: response regulator [Candidatus Kapabacteria bacterium]|nr:response regulator [Candidatus Kapabacteria bacterium]
MNSSKIRVALIDDGLFVNESFETMLGLQFPIVEVVCKAESVYEGIMTIKAFKPELVFLDIKYPDGTGFDILKNTKDVPFKTILVTDYNEYAKEAFEHSVLHYIKKPYRVEDISNCLELYANDKENNKFKKTNDNVTTDYQNFKDLDYKDIDLNKLSFIDLEKEFIERRKNVTTVFENETLLYKYEMLNLNRKIAISTQNYNNIKNEIESDKIVINTKGEAIEINKSDIAYCVGDGNYTDFVLSDSKTHTVSKKLKSIVKLINSNKFIRISKKHLVNFDFVKEHKIGMIHKVIMKCNTVLQIGRIYKEEFIQKYNIFKSKK